MELLQDDEALALAELLLGPAPKTTEPSASGFFTVPSGNSSSSIATAGMEFAPEAMTPGPVAIALRESPTRLFSDPEVSPTPTIDLRTEPTELDLVQKSEFSSPQPLFGKPRGPVDLLESPKPALFSAPPAAVEPKSVARLVDLDSLLSLDRRSKDSKSFFPERTVVQPEREVSSLFGSRPDKKNLTSPVSKSGLFGLQNFEEPVGVRMIPAVDLKSRRSMTPWYLGVGALLAVGAGLGVWSVLARDSSAEVNTSSVSLIPATVLTTPAPAVAVTTQQPNTTILITSAPVTSISTTELVADTSVAETSPITTAVTPRPTAARPARPLATAPVTTAPATTAPSGTIPSDATVGGLTPPAWQSETSVAPAPTPAP